MKTIPNRDQQIGWAVFGVAIVIFLTSRDYFLLQGVLLVGLAALGFLFAYKHSGFHGFVVPFGILAGIATSIFLEGFWRVGLLSVNLVAAGLALGFWLIQWLEPKRHRWALYPALLLTIIAFLIISQQVSITHHLSNYPWMVALLLFGISIYFLNRENMMQTTTAMIDPQPTKLERLTQWRSDVAAINGLPEAEILRTEQLEKLARLSPENVAAMFGILDTAQIERYGKTLIGMLK